MFKEKKYADCANVVMLFDLHSKVDIQALMTELIKGGHHPLTKKLAEAKKEYKLLLINLLCSNENCKKAARLIKDYNFSILDFPHLIIRLQKKAVRYYINCMAHKKGMEQMSLGQVLDLVENYPSAQLLLFGDLMYQEMFNESFVLAEIAKLWKYMNPAETALLKSKVIKPDEVINQYMKENMDFFGPITPDSFKIPCKCEDVLFVDNAVGIEKAKGLLKASVIGIDCEWRPTLMTFVTVKPAIMQVSSENLFVIFDLTKLEGNPLFGEFIKELFMSPTVIKLGLALREDMRLVCKTLTKMTCFHYMFSYIDIAEFYKDKYPGEKTSSLAAITEKVLSKVWYLYNV